MTLWARLTWQAKDPAALAADLERRLGVVAAPGGSVSGALTLALGTAVLEIRPWQREAPADVPRSAGRLVFEPVPGGEEAPAGTEAPPAGTEPPPAGMEPPRLVLAGLGWATVDLDRAAAELEPWLEPRSDEVDPLPGHGAPGERDEAEPHLGARARRRGAGVLPGGTIVLLEPATEGRLAASLARDGEGPCALYLEPRDGLAAWRRAARARGVATTIVRRGPLGASSLLLGGGVTGPHLVLVDRPGNSSAAATTGTIPA